MKVGLEIFNTSINSTDNAINNAVDFPRAMVVDSPQALDDLKPSEFYKDGKLHRESPTDLKVKKKEFFEKISQTIFNDAQVKKLKQEIDSDYYKGHKISKNLHKAITDTIDVKHWKFLVNKASKELDMETAEKHCEKILTIEPRDIRVVDLLIKIKMILGKDQDVLNLCNQQKQNLLNENKDEFQEIDQKTKEAQGILAVEAQRDNGNLTSEMISATSKLKTEISDIINEAGNTLDDGVVKQVHRGFDALKSGRIQKGMRLLQYATRSCWENDVCKIMQLRCIVSQGIEDLAAAAANPALQGTQTIAEELHKKYPKNELVLTALVRLAHAFSDENLFMKYGAELVALGGIKTADGFFYRGLYRGKIRDIECLTDLQTAYDLYPDNDGYASALSSYKSKFPEKNPSPVKKPEVIKENKPTPVYETIEIPSSWYLMAGTGVAVLLILWLIVRKYQQIQIYKAEKAENIEKMEELTKDFATGKWSYENGWLQLDMKFQKNFSPKKFIFLSDYFEHTTLGIDLNKAKTELRKACETLYGRINVIVIEQKNLIKIKVGPQVTAEAVSDAKKEILKELARESPENKFVGDKKSLRENWKKCDELAKKQNIDFGTLSETFGKLETQKDNILKIKTKAENDKRYQADKKLKISEEYYDNIITAADRAIATYNSIVTNKTTVENDLKKFSSAAFTELSEKITQAKYTHQLVEFTTNMTSFSSLLVAVSRNLSSIRKQLESLQESNNTIGNLVIKKDTESEKTKQLLNKKEKDLEKNEKEEKKKEDAKREDQLKKQAEDEKRKQEIERKKQETREVQQKNREKNLEKKNQKQSLSTPQVTTTSRSDVSTLFGFVPKQKVINSKNQSKREAKVNKSKDEQILDKEDSSNEEIGSDAEKIYLEKYNSTLTPK